MHTYFDPVWTWISTTAWMASPSRARSGCSCTGTRWGWPRRRARGGGALGTSTTPTGMGKIVEARLCESLSLSVKAAVTSLVDTIVLLCHSLLCKRNEINLCMQFVYKQHKINQICHQDHEVYLSILQAMKGEFTQPRAHYFAKPYSHVMRVTLYPTRLSDNGEYREAWMTLQQNTK